MVKLLPPACYPLVSDSPPWCLQLFRPLVRNIDVHTTATKYWCTRPFLQAGRVASIDSYLVTPLTSPDPGNPFYKTTDNSWKSNENLSCKFSQTLSSLRYSVRCEKSYCSMNTLVAKQKKISR